MISLKNTLKIFATLLLLMVSASQADTSMTYIHTDHLGSPIAATDEADQVKWTEEYQPFGVQRTNQDSDNSTGFTGHQYDDELELTYMQARWYHPEVGRFMSLDPVDTLGHIQRGNPIQGFNRYAYANNNPYKYVDPDGEFLNFVFGFVVGAAIEATVQLATTGQVDLKSVAIAGAVGSVTGGIGGRLTTQAVKGTISASKAVKTTAAVGGVANAGGTVVSNAIDGQSTSLQEVAISGGLGAIGAGIGGTLANKTASKLEKLSESSGLGHSNIARTTNSANIGKVKTQTSAGVEFGKVISDGTINATQKKAEEE